jgi:hypothetical protein
MGRNHNSKKHARYIRVDARTWVEQKDEDISDDLVRERYKHNLAKRDAKQITDLKKMKISNFH